VEWLEWLATLGLGVSMLLVAVLGWMVHYGPTGVFTAKGPVRAQIGHPTGRFSVVMSPTRCI
jgi:hypothetical protein